MGPCYPARAMADELFRQVFLPLYPADVVADLASARRVDANPGGNPALLKHLEEAGTIFAAKAPGLLGTPLALDGSDASVHHLSAALTRERRDALLAQGTVGGADNGLFNFVVHGAAYVGGCIVKNHGGGWRVRRPLWESMVGLSSAAGEAELAVFHWWLRALTEGLEGGATLADRYRTHVEVPSAAPSARPILFGSKPNQTRALPRLAKVTYSALYKYMKAHLPEMREVGQDFPSAERLDELGLKFLDPILVGGGRMVVLFGPGRNGAHFFWMGEGGFEKGAFVPCDGFPEPLLKVEGDILRLHAQVAGQAVTHEMLWWGP